MTVPHTQQGTEQQAHQAVEAFLRATTTQELDAAFDELIDLDIDSLWIAMDNQAGITFIQEYPLFPLYALWSIALMDQQSEEECTS